MSDHPASEAGGIGESDRRFLADMLAQIDDAAEVIALGEAAFLDPASPLTFRAATSVLIDFSAAADRVSERMKTEHPEIPWAQIRRIRSKLAHHDEGIERDLLWATITGDLPHLARRLRAILDGMTSHP